MSSKIKKYKEFLNINRIKKATPNLSKLKVTLKKTNNRGIGLFATKPIKKKEIISYYKVTAHNEKIYNSPTNYVYTFTIYTKSNNESSNLIGDIDFASMPPPVNNIPFWGFFANEPSGKQVVNAEIDENIKNNYKTRKIIRSGDSLVYKLVATKNIKPNEEITWYYGEGYERDYEINI